MASAVAVIRQGGEGEHLWFAGGGLLTMKATSAETEGAFALFEDREVFGKPTPLHAHPNDDEVLYVLEGEILAHVNGEEHRVGEGGIFMAPRGVPHAFLVISATARLLCLTVPGTGWAEVQYRELCEPASPDAVPGSRKADFAKIREVADRSESIEILGPPPFASLQQPTPKPG
jgi:mannose-6-phosphate isomerase-like protein (cupin superfamily)